VPALTPYPSPAYAGEGRGNEIRFSLLWNALPSHALDEAPILQRHDHMMYCKDQDPGIPLYIGFGE